MSELIGKIKEKGIRQSVRMISVKMKAGEVGRKKSSWEKKECDR
jgi:hypothetical protein